ncbi:unnamed protein product [Acanthoscelides obtectus]|uniref:Uncharacterized protein n=1 Tax=Acanthoscelides obtectus TaxID=200917 RepID=A0A9P0K9A2_ACAOB|nr:unnamed protein product [Acanthoscelides obtectus]CAK1653402.1 hypothetical protein AOBTE_LOCUS18213 [Acanthoscelides obtectus]
MAESENSSENSSLKKNEKKNVTLCLHCKKKVVNVVKCKKCNNSFHPACLEQAGELKNTNCMNESSKVRRESVNMLLWEESTELDLLRTLVKELQSKNRIAEENSQLLREKVHFLEDRVDYLNKKVQQHENTKHPSDSVTSNEEPRKIHNVVANNEIVILENLSAEPVDDSFALPAANSPVIVNSAPIATRTEKDEDKWIEVRNRNTNKISVRNRPVDKSSRPEPLRGSNGHPNKPFSELAAPKYGKGKPKQQEVKILHINVRSLRRKIDELEAFLVDEDIDVLCLTEHWLTKEEMEVVHLQGYMMRGSSERKDFTASFGLERTIFEPTRGDSCLDNVFLSSAMELCGSQVCDIGISDHKGQLVKFLGCETTGFIQNKKMYRPVTQRGLFMLHSRLSEISWDFITVDSTSGEQKFSHFMDILQEAYTYSFPKKTYVVRSDQGNNISWFNTELSAMREHLKDFERAERAVWFCE